MKYNLFILLLIASLGAQAQGVEDLLRYSQNHYLGSARTVGVGGAFGAMGGDYSSIMINPAGLGDFKRSDFTIGVGYKTKYNASQMNGSQNTSENRDYSRMTIDQLGYVSARPSSGNRLYSNIAFGFSRQSDYGGNLAATGLSKGSMSDYFLRLAGTTPKENLADFDTKLAYDAGLIYLNDNGQYTSDYKEEDVINKSYISNRKGGMSEFTVGWGANYLNKLNAGISVGIPLGNYTQDNRYIQTFQDGDFSNNLEYTEKLTSRISGINLKAGVVYRPMKFIRLGAAVHTPSVLTVTEDFSNTMKYSYFTATQKYNGEAKTPEGYFKYNTTTPWRGVLSAGGLFKQGDLYGFVNADLEYVGYQSARFNLTAHSDNTSDADYQASLNATVKERLSSHTNIKLGAELGYRNIRVRGGLGILSTPFSTDDPRMNFSMGAGINFNSFFIDVAYRAYEEKASLYPYFDSGIKNNPLISTDSENHRMTVTAGFRF